MLNIEGISLGLWFDYMV